MSVAPSKEGPTLPPAPSGEAKRPPISSERRVQNSIAALILHAFNDSRELTAPARRGREQKFLDRVDPDHVLPEEEREKRAKCLKSAHYKAMALKRWKGRRTRTRRREGEQQ